MKRRGMRALVGGMNPAVRMWYASCRAYRAGLLPVAWALKSINFFVFKAILNFECDIQPDIELVHYGFGCAVHQNVTLGHRVKLYHHVTFVGATFIGSPSRIIVEDDVVIGACAIIIGNDRGGIRIGKGAVIGAGAIVSRDVPPGVTVLPMPSRPVRSAAEHF